MHRTRKMGLKRLGSFFYRGNGFCQCGIASCIAHSLWVENHGLEALMSCDRSHLNQDYHGFQQIFLGPKLARNGSYGKELTRKRAGRKNKRDDVLSGTVWTWGM